MTLTEMLEQQPLHQLLTIEVAKEVFKQWLKEIPLGAVMDASEVVQMARHDFITMVDEP